ncbi:MAG: protein kinase [Candidatus Eremiobacteraeota bacterium]|nr:protein kinase [Candidatus Eremiobacteraeota bacterium]
MVQPEQIGIYQVVRELGRGAMGVVYLCVHPGLGRQVAVKVLSAQVAGEADFLERFRREGEMAARLRHPNIVQVHDFSNDGDTYFIVMEYLGSQTLKSGARPLPEALRLIDQLLAALEHAHERGVIHRDLKPSNILVTDSGEIALTDFGIAYSAANQKLTRTGTAMGTPEYMAPEQFDGKSDARTDLYAVGIIFYEMLTGFTPFHADTLTEVMKNQVMKIQASLSEVDFTIPAAISNLVDKALSKEPRDRYQSARDMREALKLAQVAPAAPVPAPPAQAPARQRSGSDRRGLAVLLLTLLILSAWTRLHRHRQNRPPVRPVVTPASAEVVIHDEPTPVSTATPVAPETQTPTPEMALTETPEVAPDMPEAPPVSAQLPLEGAIRPGLGVANLNLGASPQQVESLWGAPDSSFEEGGKLHWSYSGENDESQAFALVFEAGVLVEINVYAPKFSIESHPDLTMGVKVEKVRQELPSPSSDSGATLDYNEMGLYFYFHNRGSRTLARYGEHGCEAIRVYLPGATSAQ